MIEERQQIHLEIDGVTDAEMAWVKPYMDEDWWRNNHEEGYQGFDMSYDTQGQLVIDSDHVAVDNVAWFLRHFLAANRPESHIVFDYCWHGDLDYGGAATLVTARKVVHFNPRDMAGQWQQTGLCVPVVEDHATGLDKMEDSINDEGLPEDDGQDRRPAGPAPEAGPVVR